MMILHKVSHLENAPFSMLSKLAGMEISRKDLHP